MHSDALALWKRWCEHCSMQSTQTVVDNYRSQKVRVTHNSQMFAMMWLDQLPYLQIFSLKKKGIRGSGKLFGNCGVSGCVCALHRSFLHNINVFMVWTRSITIVQILQFRQSVRMHANLHISMKHPMKSYWAWVTTAQVYNSIGHV